MTVVHRSIQLVFVGVGNCYTIGILGTQLRVAALERILVEPEFKWIEILVGGTINAPAVGKVPLLHRVLVESYRSTWKEVGIVPAQRRIKRFKRCAFPGLSPGLTFR